MGTVHRFALLGLTLAILAACAAPAPQAEPPPTGPEVRDVSMRLQWFAQFQFAGYMVAQTKGFYEIEGLNVTLNPGGPDLVPLPLVASGTDTFGSTGADTIFLSREQGIPVVGLATWFQSSPVGFMVHSDSGIKTPQDFAGRTVGMFYGDNVETEYRALLAATGIDRTQIKEVTGDYSLAPFLTRQADVWPVYITDQPNTARREGAEVDLILARDYGVNLMGDVLFTNELFAKNNPKTVQAFVNATIKGWRYAIENPKETIDIILAFNPELNRAQLEFEAAETIKLITYGAGQTCPGWMSQQVWQDEAKLLQELGLIKSSPDLSSAINNSFVASFYQTAGVTCSD